MPNSKAKSGRVGWLNYLRRSDLVDSHFASAFPRGMRELGYVEGKNLVIELRFADFKPESLPGLAAELVQLKVDVLVSGNPPGTKALQKATSTIPIVFLADSDPLANGLVASLARPGGNITGLSTIAADISPKQLEMLRSMVPKLSRVAVLVNPEEGAPQASQLKSIEAAGKRIGATVQSFDARVPNDIENAFAQMVRWKAGALRQGDRINRRRFDLPSSWAKPSASGEAMRRSGTRA